MSSFVVVAFLVFFTLYSLNTLIALKENDLDQLLHTEFYRKKVSNWTVGRRKCYNCYDRIEHGMFMHNLFYFGFFG